MIIFRQFKLLDVFQAIVAPPVIVPPPQEIPILSEISILTDKSNYQRGEIVKIAVINNTNLEMNILPPFYTIERAEKDNWIEIKRILCPCGAFCKAASFLNLALSQKRDFEWNQHEEWCLGEKKIFLETVSQQVATGRYRVRVEIINAGELFSSQDKKVIYSKEFIIS